MEYGWNERFERVEVADRRGVKWAIGKREGKGKASWEWQIMVKTTPEVFRRMRAKAVRLNEASPMNRAEKARN